MAPRAVAAQRKRDAIVKPATKKPTTKRSSPTKGPQSSFGPTLTVVVGNTRTRTFYPHQDIICGTSGYFKSVAAGTVRRWICGSPDIKLRNLHQDHFNLYMHWLYDTSSNKSSALKATADNIDPLIEQSSKEEQTAASLDFTVHSWLLGHQIADVSFQTDIMTVIFGLDIDKMAKVSDETILTIANRSAVTSTLYQWMVGTLIHICPFASVMANKDHWPDTLIFGILRAALEWVQQASAKTVKERLPSAAQISRYEEYQM